MSHIAKYQTALGAVDVELFKAAAMTVVKTLGGKLTNQIREWNRTVRNWQGQDFLLAFQTEDLPYGMAVVLDAKGKPQFIGESDQGYVGRKVTVQIENTYKALAIAKALAQVGYQVSVAQTEAQGMIFKGVRQ